MKSSTKILNETLKYIEIGWETVQRNLRLSAFNNNYDIDDDDDDDDDDDYNDDDDGDDD